MMKALDNPTPSYGPARIILRWRWLVFALGPAGSLTFELLEGHELTDPHFLLEIAVYGVAIPILTWLLLTVLARRIAHSDKSHEYFERQRRFLQQLAQRQDWDELTTFITDYPPTLLPLDETALFIYDHRHARLECVATWNTAPTESGPPCGGMDYEKLCYTCLLTRMRHPARCEFGSTFTPGQVWCLPLAYSGILVGMLRLGCEREAHLATDQVDFLNDVSSDIALALILLISYPRQLAQARTSAQLDERRHIAYVLHSSLAQQIGYLHLSLDRLAGESQLIENTTVRGELERMREVADDAYRQIRSTLTILRAEYPADLSQAIQDHARAVARHAHMQVVYTSEGQPRALSPRLSQQIFGLVQEGINNVEKHAEARGMAIACAWGVDSLSITIADDGVGFDPTHAPAPGHFGTAMMRERVHDLGGQLILLSTPGQGTRLTFRLPLSPVPAPASDADAPAFAAAAEQT